ncbi:hypothetical protein [Corynebacterium comes]|uniref:Secreted protein n=1 Tax=Corynebacterium comes TaxID=2675218 RepID=A0A6B8W0U1_9CORY|nr:hypothetical protein [Corynebacterium comes]QGU04965.1 hypothetical protein CETAM_08555 [Corynebacterium comes]
MTLKKTIAALALIAPLTFVTACGSGDGADETTSSSPNTVTSTRSTEAETVESTVEETTEESAEPETVEPEPETVAPEPEAVEQPEAAPPAEDPLLGELYEEPEPVQGGATASEADRAAIDGLVRGMYQVGTFHQFLRYIPENTCNELVAAQGGPAALDLAGVPDQPLNQWDYYVAAEPHIASVNDVRVEGDNASAVVTAVSAGQSETRTQRYLREDGRWKFCN